MKKIVLVSGATGSVGEAYLRYFSWMLDVYVVGISRTLPMETISGVHYVQSDLLDMDSLWECIEGIDFSGFSEVIVIHPIGKFVFEDDGDNADFVRDVYDSNVLTFTYLADCVMACVVGDAKVTFCCFGSISDGFDVPYWKTYSYAKKELRKVLVELSKRDFVRAVFINLSSVLTKNEKQLRPCADMAYWLKPEKIVADSVEEIVSGKASFVVLDIFEPFPDFEEGYYSNYGKIYEKWKREMGD